MASKTRESRAARNAREKAQKRLLRSVGFDPKDPNHLRFDLESSEFALLFTVDGGQESIGPGRVLALDASGQMPGITYGYEADAEGKPILNRPIHGTVVAPRLQSLDRGKVAIMSARWEDVEAIAEAREKIREDRSQMQYQRLMKAYENQARGWFRQDVPDQVQRSIFMGSNHGKDPTLETQRAIVCHKVDDHYIIAAETWSGGWSEPDENGQRERLGVDPDVLEDITFDSKKEAQEAFLFAIDQGQYPEWVDLADGERWIKRSEKLRAWAIGDGTDMKALYRRPSKPKKQKQKSGPYKGVWKRE